MWSNQKGLGPPPPPTPLELSCSKTLLFCNFFIALKWSEMDKKLIQISIEYKFDNIYFYTSDT